MRSTLSRIQIERLFSRERMSTYVASCDGHFDFAVDLYRWNAAVTAAFWGPIGHLEVALRNALATQFTVRHCRLGRGATWLDDFEDELGQRARDDVAAARARVRRKGKRASDGQTISELSFGFWRFLIAKRLTGLWPDLAKAFPNAPDRKRESVEEPIARLHDFRNRLAHHQRIWNRSPRERYSDLLIVAGYIDTGLPAWIERTSLVPGLLGGASPLTPQGQPPPAALADCYVGRLTLGRAAGRRVQKRSALSDEEAIMLGVEAVREAQQTPSRETSAEAILERVGGKRMSPEEFDKHFGHLPTDGEG
jgi:hypothetical protein